MNYAFVCHAPEDVEQARELGEWLERNSPCEVRYAECGEGAPCDMIEAAEQSLAAAAVILLLSPASVPAQWARSRWEPVLGGQPADSAIAFVELRPSRVPDLLKRRDYFTVGLDGRRRLKRWLLARFPQFSLLPETSARAADDLIEDLRIRLADEARAADHVPFDAALAFAYRCELDFEGVLWLNCLRRSVAAIYGDLACALELRVPGTQPENEAAVRAVCAERRLLLVFDQCDALPFARDGKSSILAVAPHPAPEPRPFAEVAALFDAWTGNREACAAALCDVMPALKSGMEWGAVAQLGHAVVAFLSHQHERTGELLEVLDWLVGAARERGDEVAERKFLRERSWVDGSADFSDEIAKPGDQLVLF